MKWTWAALTIVCLSLLIGACGETGSGNESGDKADHFGFAKLGDGCLIDSWCDSEQDLICRPVVNLDGSIKDLCLPPGQVGDTCAEHEDCASGLTCFGSAPGICVSLDEVDPWYENQGPLQDDGGPSYSPDSGI